MRQTMAVKHGVRDLMLAGLCAALLALALAPAARAERALLTEAAVNIKKTATEPGMPGENLEGACGVAVEGPKVYVSEYYNHVVDVFKNKLYEDPPIAGDPLDGPCQLALGPGGALYANNWHEGVERLLPTPASFDTDESTGVAVDPGSGDVYAVDRTYVAVYSPAGTLVQTIGVGALGDAYGIAVFGGRVYVPDAASDTVKVFEPATDLNDPVAEIDGAATPQNGFNSLADAAVAVDPSNGHVLVLDNLQPAFEHPLAAIDEFDSAGTFLGQLAKKVIDGEPSGLAFDAASNLYATSGNDEGATVFKYGTYTASVPLALTGAPTADSPLALPASAAGSSAEAAATQIKLSRPQVAGAAATLTATLTGPGTVSVSGDGLRPLVARASAAGARTLRLRLDRQGRRALARAKLGRLRVKANVTFTPTSGDPARAQRVVNFKRANGDGR